MAYSWWNGVSAKSIRSEYGFSSRSITDWYNYCREVAIAYMLDAEPVKLGGEGIIVEIDESKFGKSMYKFAYLQ